MNLDTTLRTQISTVFGHLNTGAAATAFPPPRTLSEALGKAIPQGGGLQRNTDPRTASYFGTAAVDIWLRAIHSFLVSAGLTNSSPIWASVSGYYASHYAIRGLAHLLGYFQLYQKRRIVQLTLQGGRFVCSYQKKDGNDHEHKLYWKLVKRSNTFKQDALFTENDPYADDSDIRHRNHANYSDHLAGYYPIFHPLAASEIKNRIEFISKISFDSAPIPQFGKFPDLEDVQVIAYHRIIGFRRLLDEAVGTKNRFWDAHRTPSFAREYMDFQLVHGERVLTISPD